MARLKKLYEIEADIRGLPPVVRRNLRQQQSKPIVEALEYWFAASLAKVSKGGKLGKAIRYGLRHRDGLCRFLDHGRIEFDADCVAPSIRGVASTRKSDAFAGHHMGAAAWAMHATLIETCKLNDVDPLAWMTDVLTKPVNRWPAAKIEHLMPGAWGLGLGTRHSPPGTIKSPPGLAARCGCCTAYGQDASQDRGRGEGFRVAIPGRALPQIKPGPNRA